VRQIRKTDERDERPTWIDAAGHSLLLHLSCFYLFWGVLLAKAEFKENSLGSASGTTLYFLVVTAIFVCVSVSCLSLSRGLFRLWVFGSLDLFGHLVLSLSCVALPCLILSCLVFCLLSCLVLSCLVLSCLVLSCLSLPCLALSCLVLSCLVLSCLVLSCLVLP
jgi:hypothetical protein